MERKQNEGGEGEMGKREANWGEVGGQIERRVNFKLNMLKRGRYNPIYMHQNTTRTLEKHMCGGGVSV